jgi:Ca2+/Na+ antiporter
MNPVLMGQFVGAFAISMTFACIWLGIAYAIPYFDKKPKSTYIPAIFICTLPRFISYGSTENYQYLAVLCCITLLLFLMLRNRNKENNKRGTHL